MGSTLPNPFYISRLLKGNIAYILPQGWTFFTRNAREEKLFIFERENNGSLSQVDLRASSYVYCFGLDRTGRGFLWTNYFSNFYFNIFNY
ncbi:hypothetical protein [Pedobacter sp. MC2016-24]|uniref:hypothetical protein n=1 Tax=Pedobacter sp. MC2016-24 TaxID=2780090 RepID=UPI00187F7B62|nr:hypothetical protein [Pedobacter sp. MC2016-24]